MPMQVEHVQIISRPDGSCIPPGGPVPMKPHAGSTTISEMSTMLPQVKPSSELSIVRMFLLFRQKARMIFPVDASSTAAGFPTYKSQLSAYRLPGSQAFLLFIRQARHYHVFQRQ